MLGTTALRLHSYVVARDYGFAPNPFYGYCTLATCKPKIRKGADIGDWVVGTGSKSRARDDRLVYAMRVGEAMSFQQYWADQRFVHKRPFFRGSKKQGYGDNIYHRVGKKWRQANSHHSLADGSPNVRNIDNDTQVDRVLLSTDFVYYGGAGPIVPKRFRDFAGFDICTGRRGHTNSYPQKMVEDFVAWLRMRGDTGFCGEPLDWAKVP